MSSHTPGKLSLDWNPDYERWCLYSEPSEPLGGGVNVKASWLIAVVENGAPSDTPERIKANARRLVAAWNACEGVPTEALERHHVLKLRWEGAAL